MRLADTLGQWLGRVEVVLAGADGALGEAEEALVAGDPMRARAAAKTVLEKVPGSPVALALLADACDLAGLDAELALTLEELSGRVGSRAEVWIRLGRARITTFAPVEEVRDAFARALAVAESGSDARREALLSLADIDLAQGDGARAELWLDRAASDKVPEIVRRRAEARLARGDAQGALRWLERVEDSPTDGAAALVRGRAYAMALDARAFPPLLRAMVLDVPGAGEELSSSLAWIATDETTRGRVWAVVSGKGEAGLPRWRAALARAEGRRDEARDALAEAVASGNATAAMPLLDAALEDRDYPRLALALASLTPDEKQAVTARDAARFPAPETLTDPSTYVATLEALSEITSERALGWAQEVREVIANGWVPAGKAVMWGALLTRLDAHARALHDLETTAALAALAAERSRPLRIAIVGEFNAGKSTFINALMGADIAPTGVLPTTATLHHLRYAQDPFARIVLEPSGGTSARERLVPVTELRAALKSSAGRVQRVEILLPIASLTRVEILDTPGFNAPDASDTETARGAFEEADAIVWLLDAAQPLKATERTVLEEARARKVPIQVLVNKADRLGAEDLTKVMQLVESSLHDIGVVSLCPPVALSARLALAGKLGDEGALVSSRWSRVEDVLESQMVARSDELKDRALRRRALHSVGKLGARASTLAAEESERRVRQNETAQKYSQAAARLDADLDAAAETLAAALEPAAAARKRDLDLVVTGREARTTAADPLLARYRVDRALVRLVPPLAQGLAELARSCDIPSRDLVPVSRTLVRGFSAAGGDPPVSALARVAVATLVEHMGALAVVPSTPWRADGRVRELSALAKALGALA